MRFYWDGDKTWYCARVLRYDERSGKHEVRRLLLSSHVFSSFLLLTSLSSPSLLLSAPCRAVQLLPPQHADAGLKR